MKRNTFKILIALICISTQFILPLKGDKLNGEPKNLSPISPLVVAPVSGKISLAGILPEKPNNLPLPSIEKLFNEIELEKEKVEEVRELGSFLVLKESFELETGNLYRAWNKENKEVAFLQPRNPETKEESSFLILKEAIRTENNNKIFQAIDNTSGEEFELIETGDFLIEHVSLQRTGSYPVRVWDKREMKEELFLRFVVSIEEEIKEFFITKSLGQGAMGKVEKAWDPENKKFVAIKQLLEEAAEDISRRFFQEANIMKEMDHPKVMPVFATGTLPSDFYIMDYIEGESLDKILEHETLTAAQTVEIVSQIAEGLDYVHNKGIIHRDIKPENIFLTHAGEVLILDFGISYVSNKPLQDERGQLIGTPHYMSPEQMGFGRSDEINHQSDIYALGILLYTLLTGESPFKAANFGEMLQHKSIEANHKKSINKGVLKEKLDVPHLTSLEEIILKASAFYQSQRYANANEMISDLKNLKEIDISFNLKESRFSSKKTEIKTSAPYTTTILENPIFEIVPKAEIFEKYL